MLKGDIRLPILENLKPIKKSLSNVTRHLITSLLYPWDETANTNVRGSITVRLTSCFICLDSVVLHNVELATVLLVWSNLNQYAGGQLCNETSPYDDCSMDEG